MKTKSSRKTTLRNNAPTAKPGPETNQDEEIHVSLKQFEGKSPAQFFGEYLSPGQLEALAGIMFGLVDIGVPIPEWAKRASRQFWKFYVRRQLDPMQSAEDAGVIHRVIEHFAQQPAPQPQSTLEKRIMLAAMPAAKPGSEEMQKAALLLPPEEAAKFFAGRARAEKIIEKLQNPDYLKMVKLAPIYSAVAIRWKQFLTYSTHADREKWLRDEKVIGENVSSREVYQAFARIELPGAERGRPKKSEN